MSSLKSALQLIKRDSVSGKWQFLSLLTDEALSALNDESILLRTPKHRLREMILAPIQVSLESSNTKLNCDALSALEEFVNSDDLYDRLEDPIKDTDLTFQFLDTISPCTIFSDDTQTSFLKLLLKLCLSKNSRLTVNSMLRIVQICTDLNSKYVLARSKEKASIAQTTLVQTVKAFVAKNSASAEGQVLRQSAYDFLCGGNSCASDLSESQLQILGVLKCLVEAIMPDNMPTQNRVIMPMYLQAIATTISTLPVSLIRHRVFLNILWQRVCPMLMWFLSNPKQERNITSTSDLHSPTESGVDRQTHGTASSIAPPTLWPEGLKLIYEYV